MDSHVLQYFLARRRSILTSGAIVLLLISLQSLTLAKADILQYVDSAGRRHFVDAPSKIPEQYRDQLAHQKKLPIIGKISARKLPKINSKPTLKKSRAITLLVTPTCPYCKLAETFLKDQKLRYKKYNIRESSRGLSLYKKLGGGGVPILQIGAEVVRGYNPTAIRAALKRR